MILNGQFELDEQKYNNEQDLFFLEKHILMNEELEAAASGPQESDDDQQLLEDPDDRLGVLNYFQKLE